MSRLLWALMIGLALGGPPLQSWVASLFSGTDAGSRFDPDGSIIPDAGGRFDPDGEATPDAGGRFDPNG